MKYFLALILLCGTSVCYSQKKKDKNCLVAFSDATSGETLYGYKSMKGRIVIPAKFLLAGSDTFCKMAFVYDQKDGWQGINTKGQRMLTPYIFDNGPDYVEQGVFRIVEQGKIGFATPDGDIVIPAQFDFVTPFDEQGYARYFIGGERVYLQHSSLGRMSSEAEAPLVMDHYWVWGGDIIEAGFVDLKGQRTTTPTNEQLARMAQTLTSDFIDRIQREDFKGIEHLLAEDIYCFLRFDEMPEERPFVTKEMFLRRYIYRVFSQATMERLQRNEMRAGVEEEANADMQPGSVDVRVLYTIYRANEFGDGHEGVQFGFWWNFYKGKWLLYGIETIP